MIILSFIILGILSYIVDLRFELLDTRKIDYNAIVPWMFTGFLMGSIYGLMTGRVISNNFIMFFV